MVSIIILYMFVGVITYVCTRKLYEINKQYLDSDDYFELAVMFMLVWPIGLLMLTSAYVVSLFHRGEPRRLRGP